jgi:hypothetical protein
MFIESLPSNELTRHNINCDFGPLQCVHAVSVNDVSEEHINSIFIVDKPSRKRV